MPREDALALGVVSLTWREAPTRTRAAVMEAVGSSLWDGLARQGATGLVEVHTCARSMWITSGAPAEWLASLVAAHVRGRVGVSPGVSTGLDGLQVLFRVSVGLDSHVQGEADIGRQVSAAFAAARRRRETDPVLHGVEHGLARLAAAGHRLGFLRPNRGLGHLAVAALEERGVDRDRPVGVVGAGAIGRRVVASLHRAGWAPPVVYNRTAGGEVLPLDAVGAHEALVVCTAGPPRWFRPSEAHRWVVDLGFPPQVDGPSVGLDRLLEGAGLALPPADRARAEAAVEREVERVVDGLRHLALRRGLAQANLLRDRFLEESLEGVLSDGLRGLDGEQRRRVVRAAEAAIRRYNHQLLTWLRAGAAEGT